MFAPTAGTAAGALFARAAAGVLLPSGPRGPKYRHPVESFPLSPNKRAFFWGGWGGSIAVIDLDARVSIAYVMNRMEANLMGDVRGGLLVHRAFGCLGN